MIFVTGPLYSGKRTFIQKQFGEEALHSAVIDAHLLASAADDLEQLAETLSHREIVIATEIGAGIVPMDAGERAAREAAGRLACLLAQRAECVVRLCCGIPEVLKGELPCS